MKLSSDARIALRKAITNHARWDEHRKANGLSLATMSRDDYFAAARALGLDIAEIVRQADNAAFQSPREDRQADNDRQHEKAREAAAVFGDDDAQEAPPPKAARRDVPREMDKAAHEMPKDAAGKLMALIAEIAGNSVNEDDVRKIVQREIDRAMENHGAVVRIELERSGEFHAEVKGHKHPKFASLLRAATARDVSGYCPNVWISGPAGSGKTHAVSMVAKALECPFHFNGAIGMAHELLGFVDGNGFYHRTAFREAYENGGCYLFDEVDGSDNAALLALNAALANGTATFPDGVVTRHKDCRIFAAANTWGFGGTSDYVGRSKIDAAFLSRFPVRIHWAYDNTLEQNICGNQDFAERVQRARDKAFHAGLKVLITPRDSIAGAALIATGMSSDDAAEMTYLAPLTAEQRRMIEG